MKRLIILFAALNFSLLVSGAAHAENDAYFAYQIVANGFGNPNNTEITCGSFFKGNLYLGTRNDTQGSQIWKNGEGSNWVLVESTNNGFGDVNNIEIMAMFAWRDSLYITTRNYATGAEVWVTTDGTSWAQVNTDGFGKAFTNKARQIVGYQAKIYILCGNFSTGGEVWASSDGSDWKQVNESGFGDSNNTDIAFGVVFDGYLYCATEKISGTTPGIEIWRYNGVSWSKKASGGLGDSNNVFPTIMSVFNNYLYVGTENNITIGETWRSLDGVQWGRVGQIVGTVYPPVFAPTISEDNRFFAWGSRSRNSDMDTLYLTKDGTNWSPVLIGPNNTLFNGIALLNFEGSIYAVSPVGGLMNNVWKLTRTDQSACPLPRGDINGDGKIGLEDAIYDLQVVSGIR